VNLDKWNKIPKDLQDVLVNAAVKIEKLSMQSFPEVAQKEFAEWKRAGMQYIDLSTEDTEKFLKIAYDETWKEVIRQAPEEGPKFRELTMQCSN
jgi:TRAP-type C4-dicarboxylate transport system substrate-binding protein